MIRRTIVYSGHVQGVGFRFTAQRAAAAVNVTGYVRNLPDGRVELVAEGDEHQVNQFADEVARQMAPHIRDTADSKAQPTGEFAGFNIRY